MDFQAVILHLNYDLLRVIMLLVVASDGGGANLARAIVVCKNFAKFGDDVEILKIANFNNFSLPESVEHFQNIKSLLVKCAEAGNDGARYILAKVILVSFSQLLEKEPNCSKLQHTGQTSTTSMVVERNDVHTFLSYFRSKRANGRHPNGSKFYHFELVWYFVKRCNFSDFVCMIPHVENYVKCFGSFLNQNGVLKLFERFSYMLIFIGAVVDVGRNRACHIEPHMRDADEVFNYIRERNLYHLIWSTEDITRTRWEEMNIECKYMAKQLEIIRNKEEVMESNSLVPDMEERFFYYIAFDRRVTEVIDLNSDPYLADLWSNCSYLAMRYAMFRGEAVSTFCDIFSIVLS